MKRKLVLIVALPLVVLAGCGGRERVRETVVPGPVVTKETVIERPAPTAAGGTAPRCTHASQVYSEGAVSCQEGREFRCNNGIWERTATAC